jgi:hypothetical protein
VPLARVVGWRSSSSLDRAMAHADAELYRAKRARRDCEDVRPWMATTATTTRSAVA